MLGENYYSVYIPLCQLAHGPWDYDDAFPALLMARRNHYTPVFTTIRLEAIWTVRISFARGMGPVMTKLMKEMNTLKKQFYKPPTYANCVNRPGYLAELSFLSIEEAMDKPETACYPDW